MKRHCFLALGLASFLLLGLPVHSRGQMSIGLYKDGKLIEQIATISTSAPPVRIDAQGTAVAAAQEFAAPAVSDETKSRNEVFARSTRLAIGIQEALWQMKTDADAKAKGQGKPFQSDKVGGDSQSVALTALLQQFIESQSEARAALDRIGSRVLELGLPAEIFQRHLDSLATFENGLILFTNAVNEALSGKPAAVEHALGLMDQFKFRQEPDLTKAGPTRVPMQIIPAPEMTRPEADTLLATGQLPSNQLDPKFKKSSKDSTSSKAETIIQKSLGPSAFGPTADPPTSADLLPTIDVQITQEIRDKATALGNSPLAIYEFVRNNVAFQPYLGSRKGSAFTLQQLAGNDTDQASLLLALLRAAGIPCRYVRGSIEMTPEQAKSWLGVDDAHTAGSILTTAGLDGLNIVDGSGNVTAIRCTRVWVEAYVPYSNYRGVPNDNTGKIWVPLDPAFKGNDIFQGQDVLTPMSFNAESFLANYLINPSLTNTSPLELFEQHVQDWLNNNQPGKQVVDIERWIRLQSQTLGLIPASLPIQMLSVSTRLSELEDNKRFKVRFRLYEGGTSFIDYTDNLAALIGKRVTIEYLGATAADQATIDSHGGIFQTPPSLVRVKPILKIENLEVAQSMSSIGMGYRHNSDMHFTQPVGAPNQQPLIYNEIYAGNSQAIAFDTFLDTSDFLLNGNNTRTNYFLELLYNAGVDYLRKVDDGMEKTERIMRMVTVQDVSEAIVESSVSVSYSFGVPQTFQWTGYTVDADRRIIGAFSVDGNPSKSIPFMKLTGYEGSAMEHRIFEETYGSPAVSTIRAIHISLSQGIPLCTITSSIGGNCPGFNHTSSVTAAVNDALSRGHVVTIPSRSMTYGKWSGTGYIDMDPATGAAGYIISGGVNGSVSAAGGAIVDWWWPIWPPCLIWPWSTITAQMTDPSYPSPDSSAVFSGDDTSKITFKFNLTASSCIIGNPGPAARSVTTSLTRKQIAEKFGGGDYVFRISSMFSTILETTITIIKPDLSVQNLREEYWSNPDEINPGAFIGIGGSDLELISLKSGTGSIINSGQFTISVNPSGKAAIWEDSAKTKSSPMSYPLATLPKTLYIEGKDASVSIRDIKLIINYSGPVSAKDEVALTVFKLSLKEVGFCGSTLLGGLFGDNYHVIKKDDESMDYVAPHWEDSNLDGTPEKQYPVCYTRNTKMRISKALWKVEPTPSGVVLFIKGESAAGLNFPMTEAAIISGGQIKVENLTCSKALEDKVAFYDPLSIQWKWSLKSSSISFEAGTNKNQVYATFGDPKTTLYHTLLHLGCKNASGKFSADDTADSIYIEFTDRIVQRVSDNLQMTYWADVDGDGYADMGAIETGDLLKRLDGNGNCQAWSGFFRDCLRVQGLVADRIRALPASPYEIAILVKNWKFSNHIRTGPNGLRDSDIIGDDKPLFGKGNGMPDSSCIQAGNNLATTVGGDDVISANAITTGPDGVCNSIKAANDIQVIAVGRGQPNTTCITAGLNGVINSPLLGDDVKSGIFVLTGADGICQSTATDDDVQLIGVGHGTANAICISAGVNLITLPLGDDQVNGANISTGANGRCETSKSGNDIQVIPLGQGKPDTVCICAGLDGILNSVEQVDDIVSDGVFGGTTYPYLIGNDAVDQPGVPGQGNANPPEIFNGHWITLYNNKYYDPSYGTSQVTGTSKDKVYEDGSLDGFAAPASRCRKNDTTMGTSSELSYGTDN